MKNSYDLFACAGMEIEYMIVRSDTMELSPVADKILRGENGRRKNEIEAGALNWSNELARHVIELKHPSPVADLAGGENDFISAIQNVNRQLEAENSALLPTGMHPLWTPSDGAELWPGKQSRIYQTYDKIFNCAGHGWMNLQSVHLNLPFNGNAQFLLLYNAIRLVLPFLSGLSASTPVVEGCITGVSDNRLEYYGKNQKKVPEISGEIIPESVSSMKDYRTSVLQRIYRAIEQFDREGTLRGEWLNSRGAIVRFQRSAIEIRVIDTQESPFADFAVSLLIWYTLIDAVKRLEANPVLPATADLARVYRQVILEGEKTVVSDPTLLSFWGYREPVSVSVFWSDQIIKVLPGKIQRDYEKFYKRYMDYGTLSSRIVTGINDVISDGLSREDAIRVVYRKLGSLLVEGEVY